MTEFCDNCKQLCCGKQRRNVPGDCIYIFCHNCMNLLRYIKPSELKNILKKGDTIIT